MVPLAGVTVSHAALDVAVTLAEPGLAVIDTACAGGVALPVWNAKFNEVGLAASVGGVVTVNVTGTLRGVLAAPGDATEIAAV